MTRRTTILIVAVALVCVVVVATCVFLLAGVWLWRMQPAASGASHVAAVAETDIEGVPCRADDVRYHAGGRLRSCVTSRAATIRGATLPAGSILYFRADGTYDTVMLPAGGATIEGHECLGGGAEGAQTMFHPNGRLAVCWLAREEVIQGVPCDSSSFAKEALYRNRTSVHFNPDGSLASCLASRAVTIGGRAYKAHETVTLEPPAR